MAQHTVHRKSATRAYITGSIRFVGNSHIHVQECSSHSSFTSHAKPACTPPPLSKATAPISSVRMSSGNSSVARLRIVSASFLALTATSTSPADPMHKSVCALGELAGLDDVIDLQDHLANL